MKLIDMKCTNCGAEMKANTELTQVVCNYCGKVMLIDDEIVKTKIVNGFEYGYEKEQGRQQAQRELEEKQKNDEEKKQTTKFLGFFLAFIISLILAITTKIEFFSFIAIIMFPCQFLALNDMTKK